MQNTGGTISHMRINKSGNHDKTRQHYNTKISDKYTVHRMQINTNCSCYKTRWLESSHVPGNMITLRRSYVTFTGCRSPRASIIRLQCLLISSCPPTHRLICRKSSRFIILHDSCVQPLTARSLSPTLEHSSAQGLFDTLHRQYGTAFLHRSPPRHRL